MSKIDSKVVEAVGNAFKAFREEVLLPYSKIASNETGQMVGKISEDTAVALLAKIGSNLKDLDNSITPAKWVKACGFSK